MKKEFSSIFGTYRSSFSIDAGFLKIVCWASMSTTHCVFSSSSTKKDEKKNICKSALIRRVRIGFIPISLALIPQSGKISIKKSMALSTILLWSQSNRSFIPWEGVLVLISLFYINHTHSKKTRTAGNDVSWTHLHWPEIVSFFSHRYHPLFDYTIESAAQPLHLATKCATHIQTQTQSACHFTDANDCRDSAFVCSLHKHL